LKNIIVTYKKVDQQGNFNKSSERIVKSGDVAHCLTTHTHTPIGVHNTNLVVVKDER